MFMMVRKIKILFVRVNTGICETKVHSFLHTANSIEEICVKQT